MERGGLNLGILDERRPASRISLQLASEEKTCKLTSFNRSNRMISSAVARHRQRRTHDKGDQ